VVLLREIGVELEALKMITEAELLTVEEAARRIGLSPWTLRKWRSLGQGPKYVRLVGRFGSVRYRASDLDDFIRSAVVDPSG
jgi:predicted DNA-binding transcriptional regulator AlpA